MADINSTINAINTSVPLLAPVVDNLQNLIGIVKWLVGGVFGLYIIFMAIKIYEFRSMKKMLRDLSVQVCELQKKIDKLGKKKTKK